MRTLRMLAALLAVLMTVSSGPSVAASPEPVVVFAAASLTDALTAVGTAFTHETGIPIKASYAASSTLARQIESGASADVFFPADEEWMDYLEHKGLIAAGSRRDVLGNRLVLIAPTNSLVQVRITSGSSLLAALGNSRVATGDPDSVPAGKYAKAALTTLGIWEQVEPRIVRAENVRSALAFVARVAVPFGIVYQTDAAIEKNVKVLDTFPEHTHPPIRYPIALTTRAGPNAQRFVQYVSSETAADIFEKYEFAVVRQ